MNEQDKKVIEESGITKDPELPKNSVRRIEKHLFLEWLATPTKYRVPTTQIAFANKYDVSEQTLCSWKNDEDFLKEVSVYRKKKYLRKASDVVDSLYKKAKKTGDGKEVKLFLEYVGDYTEKKDVNVNGLAELLKETKQEEEPLVKD